MIFISGLLNAVNHLRFPCPKNEQFLPQTCSVISDDLQRLCHRILVEQTTLFASNKYLQFAEFSHYIFYGKFSALTLYDFH